MGILSLIHRLLLFSAQYTALGTHCAVIRKTCSRLQRAPHRVKKLGFPDQQRMICRNHKSYHFLTYQGSQWKMKNMEMGLSKLPSWATSQVQDRWAQDKDFAIDNITSLKTTTGKPKVESPPEATPSSSTKDNQCGASSLKRTKAPKVVPPSTRLLQESQAPGSAVGSFITTT